MKRGDLVTVAVAGDFGKPRPALVIQSDRFDATGGVTVLLLTSTSTDSPLVRLTLDPSRENGLRTISQILVDKAMTVPRSKVGRKIGQADAKTMARVERALILFFGLG